MRLPRSAAVAVAALLALPAAADAATLAAAAVFPPDRRRVPVEPSTLNRPKILDYEREGWHGY